MAVRKASRKKGRQTAAVKIARQRDIEERLFEAEQLLVKRLSPSSVQRQLSGKWNVTQRQVRDYIREVRRRWKTEADALAETEHGRREEQRTWLRETLNAAYAAAMCKTQVVFDEKGKPVRDDDGNPMVIDAPDTRSALRAAQLLMELDALAVDKKIEIKHTGAVAVSPFAERSRADLEHFLKHGRFPPGTARMSA